MNPSQLLAQFDRLSEAPDATLRFRQFVLELAVRGKLVAQDPEEEPATELLKCISAERDRCIKKGLMKKQSPPQSVKPQDEWFPVPGSWQWVRLGTITNIVMGQSPPGETYNTSGDGIPLINGPVEFTEGPFGKTVVNQYTTAPTNLCEEGDLLICVRGSTTGRTNIATFRACIGRGVAAIHPLFDDAYVRLFVWRLRESIIAMGRGIAFPSIGRKQIEELAIPLPPLAEQRRIVGKVDELMGLCDQLEAAQRERESRRERLARASLNRLNHAPDPAALRAHARFHLDHLPRLTTRLEHVQQLRQTIRTFAVRGKLVPQDPNDEPAGEWARAVTQSTPSAEGEAGEPPFPIPKGWGWFRVVDAFEVAGGIQKTPHRAPRSNAFPYLGVGNVYRGRLDLANVKEFELQPGELERRRLMAHDILIIEGNGSFNEIGRCAIWNGEIQDCVHQNHVIRCRPCDFEIAPFVLLFLNSPIGIETMQRLAITSSGLYSLSVGKIRQIQIPIPPLAEQHRIVAKVDELMMLCDQLEAQLATAQTESRRLLEALLHEALALAT